MTDFDEKDRSLLRCTLKKSTSTAIALGKIAICIVAIVALYFGIFKLWGVLGDPVHSLLTVVFSLLVAVPWWAYAIVGGIGAILLHSFLWCIAREVTPEAYADKRVNETIDELAMSLMYTCIAAPFALMFIVGGIFHLGADAAMFSAVLSFLAIGCITLGAMHAWDIPDNAGEVRIESDVIYKIFRFLPAYYYVVTDQKPKVALCDPPYDSQSQEASTDDEQNK